MDNIRRNQDSTRFLSKVFIVKKSDGGFSQCWGITNSVFFRKVKENGEVKQSNSTFTTNQAYLIFVFLPRSYVKHLAYKSYKNKFSRRCSKLIANILCYNLCYTIICDNIQLYYTVIRINILILISIDSKFIYFFLYEIII